MKKYLFILSLILSSVALAEVHNIEIVGNKFVPAKITISLGDTLHFINKDRRDRSVVPDPTLNPEAFVGSKRLSTKDTFDLEVLAVRNFSVKCGVHRRMPGVLVTVTE